MKLCSIVATAFLFGLCMSTEIAEEENVLVLTKDNFDEALKLHQFLLVEFYAPWCGHCKQLAPKYAEAATKLKEEGSEIRLAKVDATVEKELGEKAGVRGYPTLKLYKNGDAMDYGGGRDTDGIIAWLKKKTGPPAKLLSAVEEVTAFSESGDNVVVGFFKDAESAEAKEFLKAADKIEDALFGVSYDEKLLTANVKSPAVVLFSKDEGKFELEAASEGFDASKIESFVKENSVPIGAEFNEANYQKVFGSGVTNHLLLFTAAKAEGHQELTAYFKKVAKEFKGKVTFMWLDVEKEGHEGALQFFGLEAPKEGETFVRTMRIVAFAGEDTAKYLPEIDDVSENNLRIFAQGVLDGKIERHYKSQALPEDWDALPVKVLVASNFEEVTGVNSGKNVFVEFYAPWCGHCKQLAPIWDELGDKYNGNPDIVIAKMDATENELKDVSVGSFPTIKYFKSNGEVIDYDGKRDLDGFTKFLESGGEKQEPEPEEPEEEEEEEAGEGEEDDADEDDAEEAETPVAEPEPPKAEKEEL